MASEAAVRPDSWWGRLPGALLIALFGVILTGTAWLNAEHEISTDGRDERARIHRENDALARAFEEHVRRVLLNADNALLYLKYEHEKHGGVSEQMVNYIDHVRRDPILSQIAVADRSGDLVLSAMPHAGRINISQREHFLAHVANDAVGLFIGRPVLAKISGTWLFFATRRLTRPDGSFDGIVSVGLDPASFSDFYNDPTLGSDRAVLLVGRDGFVRARRFQQQAEVGQDLRSSPMFTRLPAEPVGHYEVLGTIDGLERFVSYRALGDFPVVVAVSKLSASALASHVRRTAEKRLSTTIFTLFVAVFSLVLIRAERRTRRQNADLTSELDERRRAEEALHESQDLFSAFLDNIPAVVFVQDLRDQILYSNQAYKDLSGREAIGKNARELLAPRREGPTGLPALRGHSVALDELVIDASGRARTFETRMFVVERDGKEPLLGCISVDGTGRRQAEEQRLLFERRMQQTQKLESLGILAGGVAHDFNNLLMVILGNTDLALAKSSAESPVRTFIQNIDTAAQRAADLTNQMLAYSGKGRFVIEPISLSRLVDEMGHLMATVIAKNATVLYRLDPDLPTVLADATQIRQVVMNLITNASDAIGAREGTITISTRVVQIGPDTPTRGVLDHPLPSGDYAAVEVADTGSGMDQATQAKIFDPFFTTKNAGRGLGLASVLGIVQGHGGGIQVFSRPGQGTSFSVLLPVGGDAAPADTASSTTSAPDTPGTEGSLTVLLVDDEQSVRATAQAMLEDSGFAVITAVDGVEAIDLFRTRHGSLCAVLLDMSMPRMGGEEAFQEMYRIDPAVPVILMSGFDESEAVGRFTGRGLAGFIRKPYRLKTLLEKIREVAAGRESRPE